MQKILGYTHQELIQLMLADASLRTGVPVEQLEGHEAAHASWWVGRRDGTDLVIPSQAQITARTAKEFTPRQVYDLALRVREQNRGNLTQAQFIKAAAVPGFQSALITYRDWALRLKYAFLAAKNGLPYPEQLDDPSYNPYGGPPD